MCDQIQWSPHHAHSNSTNNVRHVWCRQYSARQGHVANPGGSFTEHILLFRYHLLCFVLCLQCLGLSRKQVAAAARRDPNLLSLSPQSVAAKAQYIAREMGWDREVLITALGVSCWSGCTRPPPILSGSAHKYCQFLYS